MQPVRGTGNSSNRQPLDMPLQPYAIDQPKRRAVRSNWPYVSVHLRAWQKLRGG